jgi:Ca2+:H+ antiporter
MKRLFAAENILLLLVVFVPISLLLEHVFHRGGLAVFVTSALAIIPLAGLMGKATEHLAERVGEGLGAFLNATFGNAAELIIAIMALRAGFHDLVKASITGSIIGNVLLVFGLSALLGGLRYQRQSFNRTAAGHGSTMLLLSAVGLTIPAIFHLIAGDRAPRSEQETSLTIAVVLMATYLVSLVFTFKTHSHLYAGGSHAGEKSLETEVWSRRTSFLVLLGSAAVVALMSELLVDSVESAAHALGMTEVFIGVVLVAVIGNAAEHSTAVLMALKNKMDLSINIAVGSSIQIALFAAPLLVFVSYVFGPSPIDLRFTTMEVVAIAVAVGIMVVISQDGETHWMEGVQLLAVYTMLGIAFYFLPA